jgi:hypothetical protein
MRASTMAINESYTLEQVLVIAGLGENMMSTPAVPAGSE